MRNPAVIEAAEIALHIPFRRFFARPADIDAYKLHKDVQFVGRLDVTLNHDDLIACALLSQTTAALRK